MLIQAAPMLHLRTYAHHASMDKACSDPFMRQARLAGTAGTAEYSDIDEDSMAEQ